MEAIKTVWSFIQNEILGMQWLSRLIGSALEACGLDIGSRVGGSGGAQRQAAGGVLQTAASPSAPLPRRYSPKAASPPRNLAKTAEFGRSPFRLRRNTRAKLVSPAAGGRGCAPALPLAATYGIKPDFLLRGPAAPYSPGAPTRSAASWRQRTLREWPAPAPARGTRRLPPGSVQPRR